MTISTKDLIASSLPGFGVFLLGIVVTVFEGSRAQGRGGRVRGRVEEGKKARASDPEQLPCSKRKPTRVGPSESCVKITWMICNAFGGCLVQVPLRSRNQASQPGSWTRCLFFIFYFFANWVFGVADPV